MNLNRFREHTLTVDIKTLDARGLESEQESNFLQIS